MSLLTVSNFFIGIDLKVNDHWPLRTTRHLVIMDLWGQRGLLMLSGVMRMPDFRVSVAKSAEAHARVSIE